MGDNYTIPCPVVQDFAKLARLRNEQDGCMSCSVNKFPTMQALQQIRHPDNCNLYHAETPYPPLPQILSPNQSSNVSWSSYTMAKDPMFTYSTPKINSGGPFQRFNMNLYWQPRTN